jgi:hypothetical protein
MEPVVPRAWHVGAPGRMGGYGGRTGGRRQGGYGLHHGGHPHSIHHRRGRSADDGANTSTDSMNNAGRVDPKTPPPQPARPMGAINAREQ